MTHNHPKFFKEFIKRGWTVEIGKKAFKLRHPVYGLVTASLTPSCKFYEMKVTKDIERKERHNGRTNTDYCKT